MDKIILERMMLAYEACMRRSAETGEDPNDLMATLSDAGKPNVSSVRETNESGEVMTFVCVRTSSGPAAVPGCTTMVCDGCREEVWISPGTLQTFEKIKKHLVVCLDCMAKQLKDK